MAPNTSIVPPSLLNADGTVPARNAQAVLAVLRIAEGDPGLPGDRTALHQAGLTDEQIGAMKALAKHQAAAAAQAPTSEDKAREQVNASLERAEQRAKDVRAAKAYLQEKYGETGIKLDNWSEDELLQEAGLQLTEEQRRDAEIEAYNERFASDPQFAARELREKERALFLDQAPSLAPQVRAERGRALGLDPSEVEEHVAYHWQRRGLGAERS